MKKTILKHCHRPVQLLPAFLCPVGLLRTGFSRTISKKVRFLDNCSYEIDPKKQGDWNKLFGVCFGITGIHRNSIRFGWRYNIADDVIELCVITYNNGEHKMDHIKGEDIRLNQYVNLSLTFTVNPNGDVTADFSVNGRTVRTVYMGVIAEMFYFGCGLYFGGKTRAPHKMQVEWEKI